MGCDAGQRSAPPVCCPALWANAHRMTRATSAQSSPHHGRRTLTHVLVTSSVMMCAIGSSSSSGRGATRECIRSSSSRCSAHSIDSVTTGRPKPCSCRRRRFLSASIGARLKRRTRASLRKMAMRSSTGKAVAGWNNSSRWRRSASVGMTPLLSSSVSERTLAARGAAPRVRRCSSSSSFGVVLPSRAVLMDSPRTCCRRAEGHGDRRPAVLMRADSGSSSNTKCAGRTARKRRETCDSCTSLSSRGTYSSTRSNRAGATRRRGGRPPPTADPALAGAPWGASGVQSIGSIAVRMR